MNISKYNITLNVSNRVILLNSFSEAIDEIDSETEELLREHALKKFSQEDLTYLIERGYVENDTSHTSIAPLFKVNKSHNNNILNITSKDESINFFTCNIKTLDKVDILSKKIIITDSYDNFGLLEEKAHLIDMYLQNGTFIEFNLLLNLPLNNILQEIFKYILKKGWVFLNNFSFCLLPSNYSGCVLGKVYNIQPLFLDELLNKINEKKYLKYFSLSKFVGVNIIDSYLWKKRISRTKTFCNYYSPIDNNYSIDNWMNCTYCSLNQNPSKTNYDISIELKNYAQKHMELKQK